MQLADKGDGHFDVVGIGNAIVDIVAYADDALVEELGLVRAAMTLVRTTAEDSAGGPSSLRSRGATAGTSRWISNRSTSGPDNRPR